MQQTVQSSDTRKALVQRYWYTARGFWSGETRLQAWALWIGLLVVVLLQIGIQYRLNLWTRDVFNAVEQKDASAFLHQALLLLLLTVLMVSLAVTAVYGRLKIFLN